MVERGGELVGQVGGAGKVVWWWQAREGRR